MLRKAINVLVAPDPVHRWLERFCHKHGIDCTPTWGRLLAVLLASLIACIVYYIIKWRRDKWEVMAGRITQADSSCEIGMH